MLEIAEEDRVDFVDLKGVMPDYQEICEFFYKVKNNLLEDEIE
jgi:hypothetical protein